MNTIDLWEEDAKGEIDTHIPDSYSSEINLKIIKLIDLIRRKDEALFHLGSKGSWIEGECITNDIRFQGFSVIEIAEDALALTDGLK